jgi:hypothetical protein
MYVSRTFRAPVTSKVLFAGSIIQSSDPNAAKLIFYTKPFEICNHPSGDSLSPEPFINDEIVQIHLEAGILYSRKTKSTQIANGSRSNYTQNKVAMFTS